MTKFKLHWPDGKVEVVEGHDIADAFTRAGYGAGAIRALDYYEMVEDDLGFYEQMILDHSAWPADLHTSNWPPKMWQGWRVKR